MNPALRKQKSIHQYEVAGASPHYEQMEDFVASEIFMFVIEDGHFQCIDDSSDCIDNPSCKEPEESGSGHVIQDLRECQYAGPSHSDVQNGRYPFWTEDPECLDEDSYNCYAPDKCQKNPAGFTGQNKETDRGITSCDQNKNHHMVNLFQYGIDLF